MTDATRARYAVMFTDICGWRPAAFDGAGARRTAVPAPFVAR